MEVYMNSTLEQRLKELVREAEQVGAPAVHTVLNLLLAAHDNGNHHKFAKHCCEFTPFGAVKVTAQAGGQAPKPFLTELEEFDDAAWNWTSSKHSH